MVHNPTHRRYRCRRDFQQVKPFPLSNAQGFAERKNPELFAVGVDNSDLSSPDLLVNADACCFVYDSPPGTPSRVSRSMNAATESRSIFPPRRERGATVAVLTSLSPMTTT